jgi:hypothetical protein
MTEEHTGNFTIDTETNGVTSVEVDMEYVTLRAGMDCITFSHEEFSDVARRVLDFQVKYEL